MKKKSGGGAKMGPYTRSFTTAPKRPAQKTEATQPAVRHLDRPGLVGINPWAPDSAYDKLSKGGDK